MLNFVTVSVTGEAIVVAQRFCGPPQSGNGGYTCGLVAQALGAEAVQCTIRKPIPMERELRIEAQADGAKLLDGDEVILEAKAVELALALPRPVGWEEARAAAEQSPAFRNHPFPTCFVCGPERGEHDGLRLFPGPAEAQAGFENFFAAPWVPEQEFAGADGMVKPEFIWAAMDCPTGFAAGFPWAGKLVTGRLAVRLLAPLRAQSKCVVESWSLGNDGRKCHAGAALFDEGGHACATAKATWIRI